MDDIAFFESSKYQHRGGIWADASRRESQPSYSSDTDVQDDTRSTISASAAELQKPMPTDPDHPPVQRSHSAEEAAAAESKALLESQEASVEMHRSVSSTPATPNLSPNSRRRTWFGSSREDDADSIDPTRLTAGDSDDSVHRGRSSGTESMLSRRSSSTPINGGGSQDNTPQGLEGPHEGNDYLSPNIARRSSSQHSQSSSSRGTSAPFSSDDESSGPAVESSSSSASWRPKSPQTSTFGRTSTGSSTTSSTAAFLQNLKSRAGDKQALSNTAKEAMRKWGVNWSGLRKEGGGNNVEELPDGASGEQQRQQDSRTHRSKPSYVDVRAAVEQRKEKERPPQSEALLGAELRSDPIAIPQSDKGKERVRSGSPSPYVASSPPQPTSPRLSAEHVAEATQPRSISPSFPLQRTESGKSKNSGDAVMGITPDELPPAPIHTQPPQAKTMTIPGIHASHRGEVMSMGYVPPSPPPGSDQKKPAIQSVYRLWKTPSSSPGPQSLSQTQGDTMGREQDATVSDTHSEVVSPRPIPPPLPPRSNSTFALQTRPEGPPLSSASAALQSIVSKDKSKRASLEPAPGGSGSSGTSSDEAVPRDTSPAWTPGRPSADPPPIPARPSTRPPALPPRRTSAASAAPV